MYSKDLKEEVLKHYIDSGESYRKVGLKYGVSETTVKGWCVDAGVKRPIITKEKPKTLRDELFEIKLELSNPEISEEEALKLESQYQEVLGKFKSEEIERRTKK